MMVHHVVGQVNAINVQWYTTKEIGSLEYIIEAAEPIPIVQPNHTLVYAGETLQTQLIGSNTRVPRRRNNAATQSDDDTFVYDSPSQNLQTMEDMYERV